MSGTARHLMPTDSALSQKNRYHYITFLTASARKINFYYKIVIFFTGSIATGLIRFPVSRSAGQQNEAPPG
jgi:hypothetical protein